jgi:citrate lyase beta subunit
MPDGSGAVMIDGKMQDDATWKQCKVEIIAAFEEAKKEGKGVVTVDGRMIENLHVDNAQRTVAMAEAIAAMR